MTKMKKKAATTAKLGCVVKDIITGFTGTAVSQTEFGYGCVHINIQARGLTRDGTPIPIHSFDDQRVEILEGPAQSWPEPKECAIRLGDYVRDTVTGAVGTAIAKTIGLEGRTLITFEQAELTADGEPKPLHSAAAERVVVVDRRQLQVSKDSAATSGGPMARGLSIRGQAVSPASSVTPT